MLDTVAGRHNLSFPIDDSISQFVVALSGDLSTAVLNHSSGWCLSCQCQRMYCELLLKKVLKQIGPPTALFQSSNLNLYCGKQDLKYWLTIFGFYSILATVLDAGKDALPYPVSYIIVMVYWYFGHCVESEMFIEGAFGTPGISYDLTNQALLEGSEGVEIISHTSSFKSVRFINHSLGEWNLQVRLGKVLLFTQPACKTYYILKVFAQIVLSFCVWLSSAMTFLQSWMEDPLNSLLLWLPSPPYPFSLSFVCWSCLLLALDTEFLWGTPLQACLSPSH